MKTQIQIGTTDQAFDIYIKDTEISREELINELKTCYPEIEGAIEITATPIDDKCRFNGLENDIIATPITITLDELPKFTIETKEEIDNFIQK